jgi:hypothetical protein
MLLGQMYWIIAEMSPGQILVKVAGGRLGNIKERLGQHLFFTFPRNLIDNISRGSWKDRIGKGLADTS